MGRKRKNHGGDPIVGTYPISTGTVEVVADDMSDGAYVVYINGVPSSHIVLDAPQELEFDYMRWIAAAVEVLLPVAANELRMTHLGGGVCTLARYFADLWPASRHTVVEIDQKLGELARELFDIPRAPRVKIRPGEAFAVTQSFQPASRDVLIRDVFAGDTTPRKLTSPEFYRAVYRCLSPGGLYVANCSDHADLQLAKRELAEMADCFQHVGVIADSAMLKGRRRAGNLILIGTDNDLPHEGDPAFAQLTKKLLGGAQPARFQPGGL